MGSFSSKSTTTKNKVVIVNDIDRTVLDLKNARDRLQRYRKKLEQDDAKLIEQAQRAKSCGNTTTALNLLRLRKYKKIQTTQCEDQLLNILKLVETIDSKRNDTVLLNAMTAGKDMLKKLHEETTVDDIMKLMDEITEEHVLEEEINNLIVQNSTNMTNTLSIQDEEDIEQELLAMMKTEDTATTVVLDDLPAVPNVPLLPQVPTTQLPQPPIAESATTTTTERIAVPS